MVLTNFKKSSEIVEISLLFNKISSKFWQSFKIFQFKLCFILLLDKFKILRFLVFGRKKLGICSMALLSKNKLCKL